MSIDYNLICDECGNVVDGSLISAAYTRARAKHEGTAFRYKNKDLCKRCMAETFHAKS